MFSNLYYDKKITIFIKKTSLLKKFKVLKIIINNINITNIY